MPDLPSLLFVDDDLALHAAVRELLRGECVLHVAADGAEALRVLDREPSIDLVISDVCMPGLDGLALVRAARQRRPSLRIFLVTGQGSISDACEAIRAGAEDYLLKPVDATLLRGILRRAAPAAARAEAAGMVGESPVMREVFALLRKFAASPASVLIEGETGTGKEVAARALHRLSPRAHMPMVSVNCAAMTESLLESELFGHVKGAFTGAHADHAGCFERAAGGTLFLDEIGEMPPAMQAKMLRVLQDGDYLPVGGRAPKQSDARIVVASNRPLRALVESGEFRADLLYRLETLRLALPPLRKRGDDILRLADAQLDRLAQRYGKPRADLSDALRARLLAHPWPGNVRELFNALERAYVLAGAGSVLGPEHFEFLAGAAPDAPVFAAESPVTLEAMEKSYFEYVIRQFPDNRSLASQKLGISRDTFYRKLKKYNLD